MILFHPEKKVFSRKLIAKYEEASIETYCESKSLSFLFYFEDSKFYEYSQS
jgi:hypothetical protein